MIPRAAVLAASLVAATALAQPVPPGSPSPSPSPSPSVLPTAPPAPKPSPTPGPPVVVWLLSGDRLTGTIASETKTGIRVKLPFATILIPKSRIERLIRADGKEEVLHAVERVAAAPPAPGPPAVPTAHLVLVITGASFWQAWDRKDAPPDPTLRLQVRIDEAPVATWMDGRLDPEDLKGAIVNTFGFTSGDAAGMAAPHVLLTPPEVQPGRVVLRLDVPIVGEKRRLGIAYQINEASPDSPAWRDVAMATATVTLRPEGPTPIQVRQERGRMEFARKRMRDVESFHIEIATE